MTSTRAKAHNKRYLSGPILHRDMAPFYSAIDIDAGWLPKIRQVGKSGTKVKPKLYIMAGVSGAPEHLEGMESSDLIIAINSDEQAPIFRKAHYGTTCDMFQLLPALTDRLNAGNS
jgi:electron transfer flavoprotein alpha subunit